MNICQHLTDVAGSCPDQEAIVFDGKRFTYQQLDRLSIAAASRLADAGVTTGDRVAILLPNVPAFVVWYYATLRIGAIAVSVSTRLAEQEVAYVVDDCAAKVLVADPTIIHRLREHLPDCLVRTFEASEAGDACDGQLLDQRTPSSPVYAEAGPDDPALILYTSGTTGFAKGATLSHQNVRSNVLAFNRLCQTQPEDRVLLTVPLFHCFGQNAILNSVFNAGGTIVLQRQFDLKEAKRLISEEQVTQLYGVPMMFQMLLESCQPVELQTIRYCFSAAATLPIQLSRSWQDKFSMPIYEGYGLTETSPFASYNHRSRFVPGSIGTPIDLVEMKIVDTESGEDCPSGELGEIAIRGPNVMLGYWNRPDDTASVIRDGWFHSGDIGHADEQGYFYIVDRVKDMIAVGGLKVYPAEVERVLLDHDAISQVAIVGYPDKVFGEQVVAFVVLSDEATCPSQTLAAEIRQHGRSRLANYKVPKQVLFVEELPRNASGKVLKTELRQRSLSSGIEVVENSEGIAPTKLSTSAPGVLSLASRPPTLRRELLETHVSSRKRVAIEFLQDAVSSLAGIDQLPDPERRLLDVGLDSLMIVELSSQIQVEVGPEREIPATLVFDYPRILDLAEFLVNEICPVEDSSKSSVRRTARRVSVKADTSESRLELRQRIESMSEEEALDELMRELENESR